MCNCCCFNVGCWWWFVACDRLNSEPNTVYVRLGVLGISGSLNGRPRGSEKRKPDAGLNVWHSNHAHGRQNCGLQRTLCRRVLKTCRPICKAVQETLGAMSLPGKLRCSRHGSLNAFMQAALQMMSMPAPLNTPDG